jgi:hypothetical protein
MKRKINEILAIFDFIVMPLIALTIACTGFFAYGQAVPGPTLPPPVSKILSGYQANFSPIGSTTILISTTTSAPIYLKGFQLTGIVIPAAFTGTSITFLASLDGVTYNVLKNTYGATTVSYAVAPNEFLAVLPVDFAGVNYLKIVSSASEVAQRTLNFSTRGL